MNIRSRFVVAVLLACSSAMAGSLDDIKLSCGQRASINAGKHWLEQCVENVFGAPIHPALQTIAPGTGLGLGIGVSRAWRRGELEIIPSGVVVASADRSSLLRGDLTLAFPAVSLGRRIADAPDGVHEHGTSRLALDVDAWDIDAKASISFRARRIEAQRQAFYGESTFSTLSGLAYYHQRETSFGLTANDPITPWAETGVAVDESAPHITGANMGTVPPLDQRYHESSAPGIEYQPRFMRYEPYLHLRFTHLGHDFRFTDLKLRYAFYHDLDTSRYSFQQFSATSETEYQLRIPSVGTASHRSALKNFLCPEMRGAHHCSLGTLSVLDSLTVAQIGKGSVVPFYLQPTLGGATVDGSDTLRGFVDFRFRGPDRMFFQTEYRHAIWGPVGLISFYDVGRVAQTVSDLSFVHLRHDFGLGLTISATNRVVIRAYVAFGSGEPIRPNAKFGAGI
ncbi:MAG: hypothetical protein ABJA67_10735 [Chthonomonadales bacterium]